ncbi:MAG: serine hydrolase, partial [Chitinophagaceae bacterium]
MIPAIKKLENPLDFEPGTQWRYCNMGYSLLGMIVEKISGQSLASYLSTAIFKPAEMKNTFLSGHRAYDKQAKGYMVRARYEGAYILAVDHKRMRPWSYNFSGFEGCTNIWSTIVDLEKFDLALRKNIFLNKTYTDLMYTPVKLANGELIVIPGEFGQTNFGLGWFLPINEEGAKIAMHGGIEPGFFSMLWRDLTNDRAIILLDNQQSESFGHLTASSIELLTDKKITEKRRKMRSLYLEYVRTMHHKGIVHAEEFLTKNVGDSLNFYRSEHELNDLGLELSDDGYHQKALKVLKTATIAYPESWNVFDSYGKALLAAGEKKEAIEMYKQSLKLNAKNGEAKAILDKLQT